MLDKREKLRAWLLSRAGEIFTAYQVQDCSKIAGRSMTGNVLREMTGNGEIERTGHGTNSVRWHVIGRKKPLSRKCRLVTPAERREMAGYPPLETYKMIEPLP